MASPDGRPVMITPEWLRLALEVFWGIGTVVALLLGWWTRRTAAERKALAETERRLNDRIAEHISGNENALDDLRARMGRVEERIDHLPKGRDIADVRDALAQLATQVSSLAGEQRATARLVEQINQYLMEHGR